jgi:hypothetical protein
VAARRLLIVMLILLGLSTLAAALVPQRTLNDGGTTGTTTTQTTTSATAKPNPAFRRPTKITVGTTPKGKRLFPLVRVDVGNQFTLLVRSSFPTQIEIRAFGLIGFATPDTPARFELLADTPETIGVLFGPSAKPRMIGQPAARIVVVQPGAKEQKKAAGEKAKNAKQARKKP